jgi:hypothetical protein
MIATLCICASMNLKTKLSILMDIIQWLLNIQIVFEGIIGDGNRGDIAIDDISIRSGSCSMGITIYLLYILVNLISN